MEAGTRSTERVVPIAKSGLVRTICLHERQDGGYTARTGDNTRAGTYCWAGMSTPGRTARTYGGSGGSTGSTQAARQESTDRGIPHTNKYTRTVAQIYEDGRINKRKHGAAVTREAYIG